MTLKEIAAETLQACLTQQDAEEMKETLLELQKVFRFRAQGRGIKAYLDNFCAKNNKEVKHYEATEQNYLENTLKCVISFDIEEVSFQIKESSVFVYLSCYGNGEKFNSLQGALKYAFGDEIILD